MTYKETERRTDLTGVLFLVSSPELFDSIVSSGIKTLVTRRPNSSNTHPTSNIQRFARLQTSDFRGYSTYNVQVTSTVLDNYWLHLSTSVLRLP